MSYFEECLKLGEWLSETDRRGLYKYLLESNKENYKAQANLLRKNSSLNKKIANGEIIYSLRKDQVAYKARKIGSVEFTSEMRKMNLMGIKMIDTKNIDFPIGIRNVNQSNIFSIFIKCWGHASGALC